MARNRVIYQSEALYVSDDASSLEATGHAQLHRVQSANYNFSISRTDVNQFGQVGRIDSLILESPTVGVDFSYLLHDGLNESNLGFALSSDLDNGVGFLSGHFAEGSGRNLFIVTAPEGNDINIDEQTSTGYSTIGIGNAYITDYSLEASVGSLPTVSVSMEGLNMNADAIVSGSDAGFSGITSPAVKREDGTDFTTTGVVLPQSVSGDTSDIAALRPGDIEITFSSLETGTQGPIVDITSGANGAHIQSISLSTSVSRTPIERIGSRFAYARPADFPVTASLSVSAIVNDVTAASLNDIIDNEAGTNIQLTFKDPSSNNIAIYKLLNAKLDSESISSSIGSNKSVDLTFSTSIGGPQDQANNIFFSGAAV